MSMTIAFYARRKRFALSSVVIRLRHWRVYANDCRDCMTKDVRLDQIDTQVELTGALTAPQRAELFEVTQECPVHRTLKSDIHITTVQVPDRNG